MDRKTKRLVLIEKICEEGIANSFVIMLGEKCIGQITICRNKEISYEVFKEYRNHGYATEALEEVMKIAFSNGRNPILVIDYDNIASTKVAKKAGFSVRFNQGEWSEWEATSKKT